MENIKILVDGIEKNVYGIFYIYDSKYYFIYTEKEVDENNYVILYMTQVGKEIKNTENGPIDTGYMVGVEITDPEEQKKVQTSVSYIVEDKKNNTTNSQIQYLPMSMLTNLKIVSKKRFRLLKSIMIDNFKLEFNSEVPAAIDTNTNVEPVIKPMEEVVPINPVIPEPLTPSIPMDNNILNNSQEIQNTVANTSNNDTTVNNIEENNIIIDYRTKYFEEEEKNKELQSQIELLTQKLNEIKKVIE